jgi:putative membrane protein
MMTGFGMGLGGFLLTVVFWIVIIAAAIWLLSSLFPRNSTTRPQGNSESAVDVLKTRFARGEIGKEEFEAIRRDLEQ